MAHAVQHARPMARRSSNGDGRAPRRLPLLGLWPLARQAAKGDALGLGHTAASARTDALRPRTEEADAVVRTVCPFCAVGCGQLAYVKDGAITDIEGDPDSPLSEGCLCPKGAATFQLVTGAHRLEEVLYRRPGARDWEKIPLAKAMEMVAQRVKKTRDETWQASVAHEGKSYDVNRTMGIAHLGGATLDNEENYLIKKLFTGLGIVQIENQARI
jgi:formate dehydrogenase major subunit